MREIRPSGSMRGEGVVPPHRSLSYSTGLSAPRNAACSGYGQRSPDRGLWGYQLASVKKTLALFQPVPTVSFRFGKLWTEPLWLGEWPGEKSGVRSQESESRRRKAECRSMASKYGETITGRPRLASGRDARATAGTLRGPQKKECLFLTNIANMLLKTKDWENERSQTKPIESNKLLKTKDKKRKMVTNKANMLLKTKDWEKLTKTNNPKLIARESFAEKRRCEAAATSSVAAVCDRRLW